MKLGTQTISPEHITEKPVVILYSPNADGKERIFVHSLFHNLEKNGLKGQVWLDWEEGQWELPEMKLQRYIDHLFPCIICLFWSFQAERCLCLEKVL